MVALVTVARLSCAYALWSLGALVCRGCRFFPDPTGRLIIMDNSTCKQRVPAPACLNKARRYLFTLAPAAADLVLLSALGVLLWIA
jgi:hypothetical protein